MLIRKESYIVILFSQKVTNGKVFYFIFHDKSERIISLWWYIVCLLCDLSCHVFMFVIFVFVGLL